MQPEVFDTTKNNNIELETANKLVEMYEKQMSQIKNDQQHQHHQQQQQQQQQQNQQQNQQQQQQQQEQQISAVSQTVNQAAINGVVNHQTVSMHQQLQHQQLQSHQQQPQQQQQQLQPVTKEEKQNENQSPSKDTSTETIDVTTVPVTSHQNNLNIILNGSVKQPSPQAPQDPNNTTNLHLPYNREIAPPNSIYGIESLTANKPYDAEVKTLPESIEPPRFPNNFNISSPHHSSPDRDPTRMNHRFDNNWVSPVKAHPFRGLCPPTSPYVDTRDPNNMTAVAGQARRFVPPFYGNGRNFGVHPNVDRSRYGNYSVGSPMMSTLGYPREAMDSRYNLHIAPTLGFEEDKFKLSPPSVEDKHIWTKQEVELLLDLYEEHKSKLQDPRVRKTKVWDDIAKNIHEKLDTDVNGCQCNQKFRNMKADYQKVVEHNARAGSFRKTCKYYERLEKLLTPVSEPEKFKVEGGEGDASKFMNGLAYTNGFGSKAGTPNGTNFYDREMPSSHSSSSPDSSEKGNGKYENSGSGLSGTPNSPEKRLLNQIETTGDDESPPPSKRPCSDCSCGGINKRELIDVLKDFLREQRKREEETICKIQTLHKEKIDAVVKFLDLFQELVKKV